MARNKAKKKIIEESIDVAVDKTIDIKDNTKTIAIVLTVILAAIYFIQSMLSKGVYQHDEVAHYLTMTSFWDDPNKILDNWSKPGYKLLFVIPALFGLKIVTFFNCIVSAFSVYLTYDILKKYNSQYALLAIVFLGLSPIWFQLSFRNYSEYTSVLMVLLALRSHQREKFIYAALFISYASFVRQELFLVNGLYFLYLCFKRQFLPALLSGTFAIATQIWGYFVTGDVLFLYEFLYGYASKISGSFLNPRGLQRIPVMTSAVFGSIVPVLFITYVGASFILKKHLNYFVLVPIFGIYAYYALGDATFMEGIPINTRQLLIISPFITIFGILGLDRFQLLDAEKKKWLLVFVVPYLIVVGLYMTKDHNWVALNDVENYTPLIISLVVAVVLFLPIKVNSKIGVFSLVAILAMASSFKKFEVTEEDKTMERVANYYTRVCKSGKGAFKAEDPVYASHILFMYNQDKPYHEFNFINEEIVKDIKKGSVVFWDSHYSYRPKQDGRRVKESYFTDRSHEYHMLNTFTSKDRRVKVSVFYKYSDSDPVFEEAVLLSNDKKYQESIPLLTQSLTANPNNNSAYYYLGLAYQNTGDPNSALQNYSLCLQLNPNNQEALFNRGTMYANYGKLNEALVDLNNYVKLNSQNANAYFYLGNIYSGLKNFDQAIQYYNYVLKFNNQFAQAYHNIGLAYVGKNDKVNACANFNQAKTLGFAESDAQIKLNCQ